MTSFFISVPRKKKWYTVLKHEEAPGGWREGLLMRLQFCDMVSKELESTSITSACKIIPHSPACSLTTPSKIFVKLQAAGDSQASKNHKSIYGSAYA